MRRLSVNFVADRWWWKVGAMLGVGFFVFLADAILSDWVPSFVQEKMGGSLFMGLVMAFSSMVGLGADLIFPQLLKETTVRKLVMGALLSSFGFSAILFGSTWWPILWIFLMAMVIWGVYYELLGFANQQFVAEVVPLRSRSGAWAVMGTFKSLAYFLGPIFSGLLIANRGERSLLMVTGGMTLLAMAALTVMRLPNKKVKVEVEEINVGREVGHWLVLLKHVWPVILISLMMGLIDATFWTTGTIWTDKLAEQNWWGGMFLSAYMLPSLFIGLVMARLGIFQHKKRISEVLLLLAGVGLSFLAINDAVWWQLMVVFLASCMTAVAGPLTDAVYSDVVARMGRERKHLIGLSSSTISLAYIVGPIGAGGIASLAGERMTFALMGGIVAVVALVLLFVTPRKLKLPQMEIQKWE